MQINVHHIEVGAFVLDQHHCCHSYPIGHHLLIMIQIANIKIMLLMNYQKLTSAHELECLFEIFGVDGQVKKYIIYLSPVIFFKVSAELIIWLKWFFASPVFRTGWFKFLICSAAFCTSEKLCFAFSVMYTGPWTSLRVSKCFWITSKLCLLSPCR